MTSFPPLFMKESFTRRKMRPFQHDLRVSTKAGRAAGTAGETRTSSSPKARAPLHSQPLPRPRATHLHSLALPGHHANGVTVRRLGARPFLTMGPSGIRTAAASPTWSPGAGRWFVAVTNPLEMFAYNLPFHYRFPFLLVNTQDWGVGVVRSLRTLVRKAKALPRGHTPSSRRGRRGSPPASGGPAFRFVSGSDPAVPIHEPCNPTVVLRMPTAFSRAETPATNLW